MSLSSFDLSFANILSGVFTGFLYGLLSIGLVLVYRASRFINFAHVAIGIFAASIFSAVVSRGVPYWVFFPVGILAGAFIASGVEWGFVRRISDAPRVLGTVPLNNHSDGCTMRLKGEGGLHEYFPILKSDFSTQCGALQSTGRLSYLFWAGKMRSHSRGGSPPVRAITASNAVKSARACRLAK